MRLRIVALALVLPLWGQSPVVRTSATQTLTNKTITSPTIDGTANLSQAVTLSGVISPASISANQNDYNPSGLSTATVLRLSATGIFTISGLAGGTNGRIITLLNVGSNILVLTSEDAASTAANRFVMTDNIALQVNSSLSFIYDGTSSRWRNLARPLLLSATGTTGITAYNTGDSIQAARLDHTHRVPMSLQWFFPGAVVAGVQTARAIVPEGVTNCTITGSQITANTTASSSSTYNIQRCTTGAGDCTATANIYSADKTLASSDQHQSGGAPNTATITAGDAFRVNLVTVGTSLADVTVQMSYKCENTN